MNPGDEIMVLAWWANRKPIRCEVRTVWENMVAVKPLEGNPHMRHVPKDDIVGGASENHGAQNDED